MEWVRTWYHDRKGVNAELPTGGGSTAPLPRHSVEITTSRAETGERWWKLVWTYPDERDDSLFWQSQVLIAHAAGRTEFTFFLLLTSTAFEVKPAAVKVRPPRVVRDLVKSFPCFLGGRAVPSRPTTLRAEEVHGFVRDTLTSPDRRLPLVVISPDRETDAPLVDPGSVSEKLAGLAEVYVLADRWAGYSLMDSVGKPFACYNGAVRIYWPGFRTPRDPGIHFVYKPELLESIRRTGRDIEDVIFDRLRFLSVMRIVEGPVTAQALSAVRAETSRRRAASNQALIERLEAGKADRERVLAELADMQRQHESDQDRIAELEKELDLLKRRWVEYEQLMATKEPEAQPAPEVEEPEFRTVMDALKKGSVDFGRRLEVLDRAWRSAADSRYKNPEEVYHALEAIRELAGMWFDKKKRGVIGPWETFFRKRGFKFTPRESQTTMGLYGKERTFPHEDTKIVMEKHITLGGGSRENCLQVYFEIDEKAGKFLIGYCGVHLPYSGMDT